MSIERNDDAKKFAAEWKERNSEKSDMQSFWLALLRDVLNIERPEQFIRFELPIDVDDHKCFIDAWINSTKVLIEQKSRGVDLEKPARQSDGMFLTPFGQALRYADARDYSERPKWIVLCNFDEFRVFNMNSYYKSLDDSYQPNVISTERLTHEYARLNFLIDPDDEDVDPSIKISKRRSQKRAQKISIEAGGLDVFRSGVRLGQFLDRDIHLDPLAGE